MEKKLSRMYLLLIWTAGLLFMFSCTEDTTQQDAKAQEQRFFDLYIASHYPDAQPQASGLFYIENKEGTGVMPNDSSWVLVDHVAYTLPDEEIYDTYIESVAVDNRMYDENALYGPYKMRNGLLNAGFTEGLTLMREGGEATFLFTSDLGYGPNSAGSVGAYQSLKYEVRLLEVLGDDIEAYEATRILAYTDTIAGVDAIYDAESDAVMYYVVDEATTGAPVAADSTIQVAYRGHLIDGRVFDETEDGNYLAFTVGDEESGIIEGWHLGLERFREGEKGRLIIPYQLAYGELGRQTDKRNIAIPPYETLVFDVEVISVTEE